MFDAPGLYFLNTSGTACFTSSSATCLEACHQCTLTKSSVYLDRPWPSSLIKWYAITFIYSTGKALACSIKNGLDLSQSSKEQAPPWTTRRWCLGCFSRWRRSQQPWIQECGWMRSRFVLYGLRNTVTDREYYCYLAFALSSRTIHKIFMFTLVSQIRNEATAWSSFEHW